MPPRRCAIQSARPIATMLRTTVRGFDRPCGRRRTAGTRARSRRSSSARGGCRRRARRADATGQSDQRRMRARDVADSDLGLRHVEQRVPAGVTQRDQRDDEREREQRDEDAITSAACGRRPPTSRTRDRWARSRPRRRRRQRRSARGPCPLAQPIRRRRADPARRSCARHGRRFRARSAPSRAGD